MSWTEEKVEKLKQLWGKGNSASQIAEIIGGVSRNAVIGKAHRLNLSAKIIKRTPISHSRNKNFVTNNFEKNWFFWTKKNFFLKCINNWNGRVRMPFVNLSSFIWCGKNRNC